MLATLLVSGFVSRLCLAGLELELLLPEHILASRAAPARIVLRNLKRWMPSFSIQVAGVPNHGQTPILQDGGASLEEPANVLFPRRGVHSRNHERRVTGFLLHSPRINHPKARACRLESTAHTGELQLREFARSCRRASCRRTWWDGGTG